MEAFACIAIYDTRKIAYSQNGVCTGRGYDLFKEAIGDVIQIGAMVEESPETKTVFAGG